MTPTSPDGAALGAPRAEHAADALDHLLTLVVMQQRQLRALEARVFDLDRNTSATMGQAHFDAELHRRFGEAASDRGIPGLAP